MQEKTLSDLWSMGRRVTRRVLVMVLLMLACSSVYAADSILVFGDSLSAAHGIDREDGWVALLRQRLDDAGRDVQVVNASVSGETTRGGLNRLPGALEDHAPSIVILELGANDGLRALPIDAMRANLERMIGLSRQAGARVLLLGMRIPTNYGRDYSERFHRAFVDVADATGVAFVPFFLKPIAMDRSNFQADGVHPNAAAQGALLDVVWPEVSGLLTGEAPETQ